MRKAGSFFAAFMIAALLMVPAHASIRAVTTGTYPPYEFVNDKGELDGFDIDLMAEIGRRIGEKIEWTDTGHYDMVIPELITGKADVIAAGMSATPIRAERVLFTTVYAPTMSSYITREEITIDKIEDMKGLIGCIPVGTTQDIFLKAKAEELGFTLKNFAKTEECIWDLVTGRSDFCMADVPVAKKLVEEPNFKGKIKRGYTFQLTGAGKALAVRLGETELKARLDGAIEAMEADGTLEALRSKWGINVEK